MVIVSHNEALGLAIDGRTATARWDGQPVDYDQGIMVVMASWGPCGTGSGGGSDAGKREPAVVSLPAPHYAPGSSPAY